MGGLEPRTVVDVVSSSGGGGVRRVLRGFGRCDPRMEDGRDTVLRSPCTSLAYGGAFAPGEALEKVVIRISNGETYRAGNIWGMESKIFEIVLGIKT